MQDQPEPQNQPDSQQNQTNIPEQPVLQQPAQETQEQPTLPEQPVLQQPAQEQPTLPEQPVLQQPAQEQPALPEQPILQQATQEQPVIQNQVVAEQQSPTAATPIATPATALPQQSVQQGAMTKKKMSGYTIFWYVAAPIFALISLFLGIISFAAMSDMNNTLGKLGTTSATVNTAFVLLGAAFLAFAILLIVNMITIGIKKGRLFTAISHFILSAGAIALIVEVIIEMAKIAEIESKYKLSRLQLSSISSSTYVPFLVLLIIMLAFFVASGIYFLVSKKAKNWYGD